MHIKKISLFLVVIIGFIFISGCIEPITGEWASVANSPGIIILNDDKTFSIVSLDPPSTQYGGTYLIDDSISPRRIYITSEGVVTVPGNKFGEGVQQYQKQTLMGIINPNNNEIILYNQPNAVPTRFIFRKLAT
ncbi:MAG: hypothetical protein WA102_05370 [Candidatus Methanoperedens sp.]|nr:hypothetical protein [Candidatus Methanoperedens sp.]